MNIEAIDKNFSVDENIQRENLSFYDVKNAPFKVYGVYHDGNNYRRIPDEVAEKMSANIPWLAKCTAGGRVRFITESPYVIIRAEMTVTDMAHMPKTGVSGFDMYENFRGDEIYLKTFVPTLTHEGYYYGVYDFQSEGPHSITLNFPLYNTVNNLYVGLMEGAALLPAEDYSVNKPIVYYGSSITQGGCASRPGTAYQAYISRMYDADFINLGFSGGARGEDCIAEYIASLDMSAFVYDYEANAPNPEHLLNTHERMFLKIREKHPTLPVIMMPLHPIARNRDAGFIGIVKRTYENAVARGDKNVYYIEREELMSFCGLEGTVDSLHPTDLGFYSMARALYPVFDKIFVI